MEKRSAGFFAACLTDANYFAVPFPPGASKEDKALIMAAVLFIDYRFFEHNP